MTYFLFLILFIIFPFIVLAWIQRRSIGRRQLITMGFFALVAVLYTTLWDNYLVANQIWWYDPDRVSGITLGWVPLEEYLFFVFQPFLVGIWFFFLKGRIPAGQRPGPRSIRWIFPLVLGVVWLLSASILLLGWDPGRYLSLELVWALPPILLQLAFGADLLWKEWKLVLLTIFSAVVYLSAADWIAIRAGIWTISPGDTLGLMLGETLPVEEALFFLLTCVLILFGIFLTLTPEAKDRVAGAIVRFRRWEGDPVRKWLVW